MGCGLSKNERICSENAIAALISRGKYICRGTLRCCYIVREKTAGDNGINRILVSVPKRTFKRAVKRNLLKRRIREAYRLQKSILTPSGLDIMLFYSAKEAAAFEDIFKDMTEILGSIQSSIN